MADNVTLPLTGSGDGTAIARTTDVTAGQIQHVRLDIGSGASEAQVAAGQGLMAASIPVVLASNHSDVKITLDSEAVVLGAGTAGIGKLTANSGVDIGDVDVTSIAAGDNNIGNVDIVTVPADPFGANADAASAAGSISAKLRFIASTGIPITGTVQVIGEVAHDGAAGTNGVLVSGYASAAAPADVSLDGDAVRAWHLRNGAAATVLTAAGALIGGDAANGLDVDVTRVSGNVAVTIAQDVMLGTDFSDVFGTASLVTATQADDLVNTTDGINTTSLAYVFDGTTWDRLRGDSTNGALVNLGANNDVTVTGTVTANAGTGTFTVDSELPAAAALADNTANPTVPAVGAFGMVWDGATWDRAAGNSTDGALVNLGANNDVTVTGTVTANLAAGTNNIGDVDVLSVPAPLSTTGGGTEATALRVTIASDSTGVVSVDDNGASLTVDGAVTVTNATAANLKGEVVGPIAHDGPISTTPPVRTAGRARTSDYTAVAADDVADLVTDTLGKQVVLVGAVHDLHVNGKVNLTTADASDVIAAVASTRIVVTSITVTNAHVAIGTKVEIRDGTTVKVQLVAAAAGGGFHLNAGGSPLFISTANTAVTARCVTTGADVDVFISGYKIIN